MGGSAIKIVRTLGAEDTPEELCRLSRLAFDEDDAQTAGELARRALLAAPSEEAVLDYVAWLFCSIHWHSDAIAALRQMAHVKPLTAAQHAYIGGISLQTPDYESALRHGLKAIEIEPHNVVYRLHYAAILDSCGRSVEAALVLVEAIKTNGTDPHLYDRLGQISARMGKSYEAKVFLTKAWGLDPTNFDLGRNLAHMLLCETDYSEAARVLHQLVDWGDQRATTFLMLSITLSQEKKFEDSLAIVMQGLTHEGDDVALLMQQGVLLCCLKLYDEACGAFAKVLLLSPEHDAARKGSFAALTEAGRYDEATEIGARLVSINPNDADIGRTLQHVLTRRFIFAGHHVIDGVGLAELKRRNRIAAPADRPSLARSLAIQLRVIGALILREMITRFGRSKLGYTWAIFEPLAHIAIMVTLINTFAHGLPPMGESFAVFYFTGIIPYHLFTHTAGQLGTAILGNRAMLQLPIVTTVDVFISRGVLEFLTEVSVALILFMGFLAFGLEATPIDLSGVVLALTQLWIIAFAIGILNAIIIGFFKAWERIWGSLMSILYFSSGTFYVPQIMPENIRDVLSWNPVLQAIELVRASYFHVPHHPWASSAYLWALGAALLAAGLLLEKSFRRHLMASE